MKNLYRTNDGAYKVKTWTGAEATIHDAIEAASSTGSLVSFDFKNVSITVGAGSDPGLIYRDYCRALSECIDMKVGPHPKETLSDAELESDSYTAAYIQDEVNRDAKKRYAQLQSEIIARRYALEAKQLSVPEMELQDRDSWIVFLESTLKESYSASLTIYYAQRWAQLMQQSMSKGAKLEDVAEATSYEADVECVSSIIYFCAVQLLIQHWKYGDQLRCWYNAKTSKAKK